MFSQSERRPPLGPSPGCKCYNIRNIFVSTVFADFQNIFRSSETQRCEFAKDPANPALAHLETVTAANNKKLIVSGWWGLVRHPNYLGEVLIQWSWVLPAGQCILD